MIQPSALASGIVDRLDAERLQDVAVGRIARRRDGDPLARIEEAQESQDEPGRGARRHHDPLGRDADAVGFPVMPRDPLAQRRDAERLRVADAARDRAPPWPPRGRLAGAGAEGWPTSMWMTLSPRLSFAAAALSTSMARNDETRSMRRATRGELEIGG